MSFFAPLEEMANSSGSHPEEYGFESRTGYQGPRNTRKPNGIRQLERGENRFDVSPVPRSKGMHIFEMLVCFIGRKGRSLGMSLR